MEAAASRGFADVSLGTMQQCLLDIGAPKIKQPHERTAALINAWSNDWGWSRVDRAKAMQYVLPETKGKAKQAAPKLPEEDKEMVWDDIASIIAALNRPDAESEEAPMPPTEDPRCARERVAQALQYDFERVAARQGNSTHFFNLL